MPPPRDGPQGYDDRTYPVYSVGGLLLLILDIYCIYLILTGSGDAGMKLVWVIVVLLLPLLGPILYLLLGRGGARA